MIIFQNLERRKIKHSDVLHQVIIIVIIVNIIIIIMLIMVIIMVKRCYADNGFPLPSFFWIPPVRHSLSAGLQVFIIIIITSSS